MFSLSFVLSIIVFINLVSFCQSSTLDKRQQGFCNVGKSCVLPNNLGTGLCIAPPNSLPACSQCGRYDASCFLSNGNPGYCSKYVSAGGASGYYTCEYKAPRQKCPELLNTAHNYDVCIHSGGTPGQCHAGPELVGYCSVCGSYKRTCTVLSTGGSGKCLPDDTITARKEMKCIGPTPAPTPVPTTTTSTAAPTPQPTTAAKKTSCSSSDAFDGAKCLVATVDGVCDNFVCTDCGKLGDKCPAFDNSDGICTLNADLGVAWCVGDNGARPTTTVLTTSSLLTTSTDLTTEQTTKLVISQPSTSTHSINLESTSASTSTTSETKAKPCKNEGDECKLLFGGVGKCDADNECVSIATKCEVIGKSCVLTDGTDGSCDADLICVSSQSTTSDISAASPFSKSISLFAFVAIVGLLF